MDFKAELKELLAKHSYRENREVVLANGEKSDVYINCKRTIFSPKGQFVVGQIMLEHLQKYNSHMISGPAEGAVPIICATLQRAWLDRYKLFGCYVKHSKDGKSAIQGVFQPNLPTIVVEDVVTNGDTIRTCIELLESRGAIVKAVVALVDRSGGKPSFLAKPGIEYKWLFTAEELKAERDTLDLRPRTPRPE